MNTQTKQDLIDKDIANIASKITQSHFSCNMDLSAFDTTLIPVTLCGKQINLPDDVFPIRADVSMTEIQIYMIGDDVDLPDLVLTPSQYIDELILDNISTDVTEEQTFSIADNYEVYLSADCNKAFEIAKNNEAYNLDDWLKSCMVDFANQQLRILHKQEN